MRRLFDHDPLTKKSTFFHYDHQDDTYVIETVQDVEDLVELNKAQRNATEKHTPWGEGQIAARIPMWLYFKLRRENVIDPEGHVHDETRFMKWLNDSDNLAWRTRFGTV